MHAAAEAARQRTPAAIEVLAEICQDREQPATARGAAANALLDRAWGKPRPPTRLPGEHGKAIDPRPVFTAPIEE